MNNKELTIKKEELEKVEEELKKTKEERDEYLDLLKRERANYLNREKEIEKKGEEFVKFCNSALILQLLPIFDNFKESLKYLPEKSDWSEGIKQVKKQFEDFLKGFGVEEIKTIGEKFNPELHECLGEEKIEGEEKNVIIKEIQPGYKMFGRLLRPAKVVVSE